MSSNYTVAAYYYPNYHTDTANQRRHGSGWTEWELVKNAKPRFSGHNQPLVPLDGYLDEADPAVMAQKIVMAKKHGVDCFLFDWYWYDEGPHLDRCLNEGFLGASNCGDLKFAIMWANHHLVDIHPVSRASSPALLNSGVVNPDTFIRMTDFIIDRYFSRENYLRVQGGNYFSVYEIDKLIASFGSVDATRQALLDFRQRSEHKGVGPLHLNCIVTGHALLPGETGPSGTNTLRIIEGLGFDSITSYVWIHHDDIPVFPATDYHVYSDIAVKRWKKLAESTKLPYFPNVTAGWDATPRIIPTDMFELREYPYTPVLTNNTPANFQTALEKAKEYLDQADLSERLLTINAWNEWTEGSYLEPDEETGYGRLQAIERVFGS
jgi:hypothetical protein